MSSIVVRADKKLKRQAQKVFDQMGLDMSTAIKMYLYQVIVTESIPFPIRTENGFTVEQERQILQEAAEALRHGKRYRSAEELHRAILGSDYDRWRKRPVSHRRNGPVPPRSATSRAGRAVRRRKA